MAADRVPTFSARLLPALLILAGSVLAEPSSLASETINIGGSSTVDPLIRLAVDEFSRTRGADNQRFQISDQGTTAGFRDFCAGRLSIAGASRPISAGELRACSDRGIQFIELPIAFDAITVIVNRSNNWTSEISNRELSRLWGRQAQGRVLRWNQVNQDWPDRPIRLCGPGADSGTFDTFNKAINGSPANSRKDYSASEDDDVILSCVANQGDALGYVGYGRFINQPKGLKALAINAGHGAVKPSPEEVQKGRYRPLSRPMFLYINDRQLRSVKELRDFLSHLLTRGLVLVRRSGSIPLPASTYRLVEAKLYRHVLGTSFGGDLPVGLSIGDALRRSFDNTKRPAYR